MLAIGTFGIFVIFGTYEVALTQLRVTGHAEPACLVKAITLAGRRSRSTSGFISCLFSYFRNHSIGDMLQVEFWFPYDTGSQFRIINTAWPAFGNTLSEIRLVCNVKTRNMSADIHRSLPGGQAGTCYVVG